MDISSVAMNQEILERKFAFKEMPERNALQDVAHYLNKFYMPNRQNCLRFFSDLFYCNKWLPKYKFKEYFVRDLLGGITLGIVLIPQSMGYSLSGVNINDLS
jgi:hypothetical protein